MARKHALLAGILLALAFTSCQPQRLLEEPWIRNVHVTLDGKQTDDEAYTEVLQLRPNTNVFGTFPYVWLYLQAKPGKTSGYATGCGASASDPYSGIPASRPKTWNS